MKLNNFYNIVGLACVITFCIFVVDKCTRETIVAPIAATANTKADSLQNVIDSLQREIEVMDADFDSRETRYKDVLGEYEFGISYIEAHHPDAFRDFHRIISFEETYKRKSMRENKKRLHVKEY